MNIVGFQKREHKKGEQPLDAAEQKRPQAGGRTWRGEAGRRRRSRFSTGRSRVAWYWCAAALVKRVKRRSGLPAYHCLTIYQQNCPAGGQGRRMLCETICLDSMAAPRKNKTKKNSLAKKKSGGAGLLERRMYDTVRHRTALPRKIAKTAISTPIVTQATRTSPALAAAIGPSSTLKCKKPSVGRSGKGGTTCLEWQSGIRKPRRA